MGALLEALCKLQKVENGLSVLRAKEDRIRRQARSDEHQIEQNKSNRLAHQELITKCQMEIDRVDLEVKTTDEAMGKHRQALNAAKSNKEYAAILTALNTEKADSSKRESRMLQLMSELDQLRADGKKFDEEEKRLTERIRRHQAELDEYLKETQEPRERLLREREEAAEQLPPSALDTFNRIATHHEGEALAEVVRLNSRGHDYICGGCNMSIPLEHVNQLSGRDELQLCSSCGRILYLETATV